MDTYFFELDRQTEVSAAPDPLPDAWCRGTSLPRGAWGQSEEPHASRPAPCWDGSEHPLASPCDPWAGGDRAGHLLTHDGCWWHRGVYDCFLQMEILFLKTWVNIKSFRLFSLEQSLFLLLQFSFFSLIFFFFFFLPF